MYTNQAQALSAALSSTGNQRAAQEMMQVLANCNQPLTTRGPVDINTAAQQRPPRAGVIYAPPNLGPVNRAQPTGDTLFDYYRNAFGGETGWMDYGSPTWNTQRQNPAFSNSNNYWGGDTFYGDNYLTQNDFITNNNFVNNVLNNYNLYDTYYNFLDNSVVNNNMQNWYTNQFIDQGYYDFSTRLNSTANYYTNNVNNFEGDSYFQNQYVTDNSVHNNVVNQGDVINRRTVINEGDVYHNNNVYLNANKTFITNDNDIITNIFNLGFGGQTRERNILLFGRVPFNYETLNLPEDACKGGQVTVSIPSNAISGGSVTLPTLSVTVSGFAAPGTYSIDQDTCAVTVPELEAQTFTVTPDASQIDLAATPATNEDQTADLVPETATNKSIQYVARIFPQTRTSVTVLAPN
jgi:hypothetical protein